MLKFAISPTSLNFFSENLVARLPVGRPTQLWRSMRKTTSRKKASESPGWSTSLIGQKNIKSEDFKRFWNWFGKNNCPGVSLVLTVNFCPRATFAHENSCYLTNCPWVSEDDSCWGLENFFREFTTCTYYLFHFHGNF